MSTRKRSIRMLESALCIWLVIPGVSGASAQSTWQKMKLQYLQQACNGGDQNSCQQLAKLKQKLSQQSQTQPSQPQMAPQQNAPQAPNSPRPAELTASAPGESQQTAEPWTPPADDGAGGKSVALDPMKIPDVVGVHLGMTPQQALAALHKTYPADLYQGKPASFWPSEVKPSYGYNVLSRDQQNSKDVTLHFTAPPGPQLVWRIERMSQRMHVNRATLLAALREKYGKETAAYTTNMSGFAATTDASIGELVWLYDEHGTRLALPPLSVFDMQPIRLIECIGNSVGEPVMPKDADWGKGLNDWCAHHLVALSVSIGPLDIVETSVTTMQDLPLAVRTSQAAAVWLRNLAQKQHQEDLQKSKEKKPIL